MNLEYLDEEFSPEQIELQKKEFERIEQERKQEAILKQMMEQDLYPGQLNNIQNVGDHQQKGSESSSNAAKKNKVNQKNNNQSSAREDSNKNNFDVQILKLENEIGITQQEIDMINQNCCQILTEENINQLKEKYQELNQSVLSLFNGEDMNKQTREQLSQFQKAFVDTIRINEQQSGRIIINKISEYLKNQFSFETQQDLTKIFMEILIKCKEKKYLMANRLEILRQFQKYIMTGILNGVDCNIFRCISEQELNQTILQTVDKYIEECEKSNINRKDLNQNASQIDVKNLQQIQDQQQQNEAYNIEKDFMELAINQVVKYFMDVSDKFNEQILSEILEVYTKSLIQIKNKLNQAEKNIQIVEQINFKFTFNVYLIFLLFTRAPTYKQENRKYHNEQYLKRLTRAIYFRKAHQNVIDIIDYFENLNNQVNQIISQEINKGLNQVNEIQKNSQPIFFSNFFDHTINQIASIFANKTIPQSLKTLIEDGQSLEHVKTSIFQQKDDKLIQFLQKNHHQQNEESKKIMDTNYFNAFNDQIQNLAIKCQEWFSYFVVSMSKFDLKNDTKSKYYLMLHEISFGKLKEVMSHQLEKYTMVNNAKRKIQDLWLKFEEDLKHLNFKPFNIYFRNFNNFLDQNMMPGEENTIQVNLKGDEVKYKICFLNLVIKQNMIIQQDKRKEFIDFLQILNSQIGQYSHIFTVFFFFLYEQCQNKEVSLATFSCEDFKNYVYNTTAEAQVFEKFYSISDTVKTFKLPFEICQMVNKLNVDYDNYFNQHIEDLNKRVNMNQQLNNFNIHYFQHYLNQDQQLTAFIVGKFYGNFTIGVQNFQIEFQEDTNPILSFSTYYSQFLFTQIFNEKYIRDRLEILFYHFCCFLKEENNQGTTLIEFNPTLLVEFQTFIQKIENQLKIPLSQNLNGEDMSNQIIHNPYEFQQQQIQQQYLQFPSQQLVNYQNDQQYENQIPSEQNGKHLYQQIIQNFRISNKNYEENEEEQATQEQTMKQLNIQQGIDQQKAELEKYKQKIAELENQLENINLQNQNKEQEIVQIKQQYEEQIQKEQIKSSQLEQAQYDYLNLIQDLENKQNGDQKDYQKIKNLQYEQNDEYIKALQNASDQKITQKQKEIEQLKQILLETQQNLQSIQEELGRNEQKLKSQKEDFKRICDEKQEVLNQIQEKERLIKQQEFQIIEFKQQLSQAEQKYKILHESNEAFIKQATQEQTMKQLNIQQGIDQQKAELEKYKQKIALLENQLENINLQNQNKEQEIVQIKQQYEEQIQKEQIKSSQLEQAQYEYLNLIQDLENKQNGDQKDYQKIKNLQYEQNDEYIKAMQNASDQKITQKQKEIEQLKQILLETQQNLQSIQEELGRNEQKLKSQKEDFKRICDEKQEVLNQIQEKERLIKQQEFQIIEFKQQLSQAEQKYKILHESNEAFIKQQLEIQDKLQGSIQVEEVKQLISPIFDSVKQLKLTSNTLLQNPLIASNQIIQNQMNNEQVEQDCLGLFNCRDYYSESIKLILNEIKSCNNQIYQINQQIIQLSQAMNETHSQQQEHQQNQNQQFQEQIGRMKRLQKELEEKLETKIYQLDQIENEKIQQNEQKKALELSLQQCNMQAQNQIKEQIKINEELQTNLNKLQEDYQKKIAEKDQQQLKITDLNEQIQQLLIESQQKAQQQHYQSQINSKQEELDSINEQIIQKQIELESLSKKIDQEKQQQKNFQIEVNNNNINQNKIKECKQNNNPKSSITSLIHNFEKELNQTSQQIFQANQQYQQLQNEYKIDSLSKTLNNKYSENVELYNGSSKMEVELEVKTEHDKESSPRLNELDIIEETAYKFDQKENSSYYYNNSSHNNHNHMNNNNSNEKFNRQMKDFESFSSQNKEFLVQNNNSLTQQQSEQILSNSATLQTNQMNYVSQNDNNFQLFQSQIYDRQSKTSQTVVVPQTRNQIKRTSTCINERFSFQLNLFCQIYYNPEARSKLIQFLMEKQSIRVLFIENQNNYFENLDNIVQDSIIIIDTTFNAFIFIYKTQSFFSWKQYAKCNKSINKQFFNQKIAQGIINKCGGIKEEFEINPQNQAHEIALLLFNQLCQSKKEFLFAFIMNSNLVNKVQIQYIDKLNQNIINYTITSFQNQEDQEILVLIIYNSFFYTFRYYCKINGILYCLYQTYLAITNLSQKKILQMIQEEEKQISNLSFSSLMAELKQTNEQELQVKLFLVSYGPLIILEKLQEGCSNFEELFKELNQTFQNIEKYNQYTLQFNFI
ncbi:hypothetical protein ABPG72_013317 [Tetrahymena utriculariae]